MSKATILFATTAVVSSMVEASSDHVPVRRNLRGASQKPGCLEQMHQFPMDLRGICRVQLESAVAGCSADTPVPFDPEQVLNDCYLAWQIYYDSESQKELFSVENLRKIIEGYKSAVTTKSTKFNPCVPLNCRSGDQLCKDALEPLEPIYKLWPEPVCPSAKTQLSEFCQSMIEPTTDDSDDHFQQAYNTTESLIPYSLAECAFRTTALPDTEHLDITLNALQKVSSRVETHWKKASKTPQEMKSRVIAVTASKLDVAFYVANYVGDAMQSNVLNQVEYSYMFSSGEIFDAGGCDESCHKNLKYFLRTAEMFVKNQVQEPLQLIIASIPTLHPYFQTRLNQGPLTWHKAITEARHDADFALHCVQTAGMLAMPLEQAHHHGIGEAHLDHHRGGNQCRLDRKHGLVAKYFEAATNLLNKSFIGNVYTALVTARGLLEQAEDDVVSESDEESATFKSLNSEE